MAEFKKKDNILSTIKEIIGAVIVLYLLWLIIKALFLSQGT